MKKILLLGLSLCLIRDASTQNLEIKKAEEWFVNCFGKVLFSKLNKTTLSNESFKKLYYYSYQVFNNDSTKWDSYNSENKLIDSIAKTSFVEAIDSMRKKGTHILLKNDAKTYIPLYIFYKMRFNDPLKDSIKIVPPETLFNWGFDEKLEPESVFRITKPFIFRLPKSKPYY